VDLSELHLTQVKSAAGQLRVKKSLTKLDYRSGALEIN
jgi:hypothetical protein